MFKIIFRSKQSFTTLDYLFIRDKLFNFPYCYFKFSKILEAEFENKQSDFLQERIR